MRYPNSIDPLSIQPQGQVGGARRSLAELIEKHGTKLFSCFEVGYSTFGGIQSIIFLPPFHKFAEINPKDATRPVNISGTDYRVAKIKDFDSFPKTAQTTPNFFLYKFIEELVQHFDYGVGMPEVQSPEFSSNFPGLDAATKIKYDNDCFSLLEITCRLYSIFYITIYAQQDLCLESSIKSGLYSKYVESRTTQPQFSVFMEEIINALQSGESLQCLFGQNETNQDALEVLLEMMLEHGLLYTAAKLGLPTDKMKVLTNTRFFSGTTDFLSKLKSGFPVAAGAPLPIAPVTSSGTKSGNVDDDDKNDNNTSGLGPGLGPKPGPKPDPGPKPGPGTGPGPKPTEAQIKAVLEALLYTGGENLTWTRIPQSKVTAFIGGAGKPLNITPEIVNTVLQDKGTELGIPLIIFNDTIIVKKELFDGPYDVASDGWCFYYSILEQFDFTTNERKENTAIKKELEGKTNVKLSTKRDTTNFIKSIKEALQDKTLYETEKKQWKLFYESQPGKNYDAYIKSLDDASTKPWADPEYGIGQAIADKFKTDINIYQQNTDGNYINLQTYTPTEKTAAKGAPIYILYIKRNHYQILLVKPGAVVPPPPPPPASSDRFTLLIKAGEIYPPLNFYNTLNSSIPYRTKIRTQLGQAPEAYSAIKDRFIENRIYLDKVNNSSYANYDEQTSLKEIYKLFTPDPDFKAIADVKMEFVDIGEGKAIDETRLEVLKHNKEMIEVPTGELDLAAAKAGAAGKISWIDDAELTGQFKKIDAEYIKLVNEIDRIDKKLIATFQKAELDNKLPQELKTFNIYVQTNPLRNLRKVVLDLNNTINEVRANIISKEAENWDKNEAEPHVKEYEQLNEQYTIKSKEFRDAANAYIEPIEKFYADRYAAEVAAAAAAEQAKVARMTPAELAAYKAAAAIGFAQPPSNESEGRPKVPAPGEKDRIGEQLLELRNREIEISNAISNEKNPEVQRRLQDELGAIRKRQRELGKEYYNLRGGTRKRHHSYPLKHTFKNRRG